MSCWQAAVPDHQRLVVDLAHLRGNQPVPWEQLLARSIHSLQQKATATPRTLRPTLSVFRSPFDLVVQHPSNEG